MLFGEALEECFKGKKITREVAPYYPVWSQGKYGKPYVYVSRFMEDIEADCWIGGLAPYERERGNVIVEGRLDMYTSCGTRYINWKPDFDDMYASDWVVIE